MNLTGKTILVGVAVGFLGYWTWMVNATGESIGYKSGFDKGYIEGAIHEREQILKDDAFQKRFEFNAARTDWQELYVEGQAVYFSSLDRPRPFPQAMNYLRVEKGWIAWAPEMPKDDIHDLLVPPVKNEKATPKKV